MKTVKFLVGAFIISLICLSTGVSAWNFYGFVHDLGKKETYYNVATVYDNVIDDMVVNMLATTNNAPVTFYIRCDETYYTTYVNSIMDVNVPFRLMPRDDRDEIAMNFTTGNKTLFMKNHHAVDFTVWASGQFWASAREFANYPDQ